MALLIGDSEVFWVVVVMEMETSLFMASSSSDMVVRGRRVVVQGVRLCVTSRFDRLSKYPFCEVC